MVALFGLLPETVARSEPAGVLRDSLWRRYATLLRSRVFMGYTLMFGFVQGGMFCFLAVGAMVFEQDFQIGQRGFGLIWGGMALAYIFGTMIGSRLTARLGSGVTAATGMAVILASGWVLFIWCQWMGTHLLPVVGPLAVMTLASGLVTPISLAGAVSYRPDMAGTCAGLSSSLGLVLSGMFTVVAGYLYQGSFGVIALLIALVGTASAATGLMVRGSNLT